MATKKPGFNLAVVMGEPKKSPKKFGSSRPMEADEEMGEEDDSAEEEDEEALLDGYCETLGLSADEFRDAVRIAMK